MSRTLTEIYKLIDAETDACVESKIKTIRLRPRRAYRPKCYQAALQKYDAELREAQGTESTVESMINEATFSALGEQKDQSVRNALILVVALVLIYLLFF